MGLIATAALVGCCLAAPAGAGAQSRLPGPDLPAASSPTLQRATAQASGGYSRSKLARKLRSLARQAPSASGYFVYDLEAKGKQRVLFGRKEGKRRKLASNTKLFTTATALGRLGATGRIGTEVRRRGNVDDGVLRGSLYLVGGGDPSLGANGMRELAREVKRSGIRRVKGNLVGDDTVFDRRRGVPDSGWGPSPYIAPLSGLVYKGSTYSGDPAKQAAKAFEKKLRKRGIKVAGKVRVGRTPKKARRARPLASYASPPVAALIEETNHSSNNFFAEMLLKRVSAAGGRTGTTANGTRAVETFAKTHGSGIDAKDGSGLTDNNRSSPRDVVRLLASMRRERDWKAFFNSLPKAGTEGTLDNRMEGTSAAKRCRGKTGTIDGVSALSGYCKAGGGLVAFSLLMNGVSSYDGARNVQDKMAVAISKYRG